MRLPRGRSGADLPVAPCDAGCFSAGALATAARPPDSQEPTIRPATDRQQINNTIRRGAEARALCPADDDPPISSSFLSTCHADHSRVLHPVIQRAVVSQSPRLETVDRVAWV